MPKKTKREFVPIKNVRELIDLMLPRGEFPVYRYPEGKGYASISYGQFAKNILATAAGLDALGMKGHRVAVIGETSHQWMSSYLGALAAGCTIVPFDKELAISEIEGFLTIVEAEVIIFSKSFNEKFLPLMDTHPTLKHFIAMEMGEESHEKLSPLSALLEKGNEALAAGYTPPERDPHAEAIMLFTSGTTGTSKCVVLSENNLFTSARAAANSVNFSTADALMTVLPLHHTYELTVMIAELNYGVTIGINDSLRHLMRNLAEYRPTGLILVPLFVNTMYKRIWDEAKRRGQDKKLKTAIKLSNALRKVGIDLRRRLFADVLKAFGGRLEKIICGGAPLNPEMVKGFDDLGIQVCEGYGITECSPLIAVTPYYAPKKGSVGPTVPDCTARIEPNGDVTEKGFAVGEIQVKGGNVMLGYYKNDEENKKAFTADGWYCTGDVGYMDNDGYIYITGRKKSVIVLENGKNVFPEEIEEYLESIIEIAECVVVGRKAADEETINLTAIVYPDRARYPDGTTNEEIYKDLYAKIAQLNKSLASFKKIKALEIRDEEFEKTTSRKIKRHLVK